MKRSVERFLTTHTGSLPRPDDLIRMMFAREEGVPVERAALAARIHSAVVEVVRKQADAGIAVVSDGELSKPSYATYIKDRLAGFGGASHALQYRDLVDFPEMAKRVFGDPGRSRRKTPACTGPISVRDPGAAQVDVDNLKSALGSIKAEDGFMSAASPGVITLFFRDDHYGSHEAYLFAVADAMRHEYETVARAGFILQLDCPDLAMGRHIQFAALSLEEFRKPSITRWRTYRPSSCACTSAGATTRGRTTTTSRWPTSSTSSSRPAPTESPSRPPIPVTRTSGRSSST
jgi:5-methyltetrahydropteroyltriglutamate--homocysteine methyltransferase